MAFQFVLNGRPIRVQGVEPNMTLLEFLRARGFTGTKEGCGEGECGACTVVLRRAHGSASRYQAVHACLVLAAEIADCELLTVEGVAFERELHPVQRALIEHGASQCGYCTPGFVMSLFAEYYRAGREEVDLESISGNLCRCTGYRSIRKAARSLPLVQSGDAFNQRLASKVPPLAPLDFTNNGVHFFRPTTLAGLWDALNSAPTAKLIAGGTDVVVEINQVQRRFEAIVSLDAIPHFQRVKLSAERVSIGACMKLSDVQRELMGQVASLDQLFPLFGSVLVRNRATLGGNLATASPIGDANVVLLSLASELELFSETGTRVVPVSEFFTGYRSTTLKRGEVIGRVFIPQPLPVFTRFYKVSKRVSDDISSVAAAFALDFAGARISRAHVAYGGVLALPKRLAPVEAALEGGTRDDATLNRALSALEASITPIDDVRASANYRRRVAGALLRRLFDDSEFIAHTREEAT